MTVGQVVDYCKTYNEMNNIKSESSSNGGEDKTVTRKATQADWDRFATS